MKIIAHIVLAFVAYNTCACGFNQLDLYGIGYLWLSMAFIGSFVLGVQACWLVTDHG